MLSQQIGSRLSQISLFTYFLVLAGRRRPCMIDSIFKKQEKISHRTPGYRIFQPIRIPYSTVVFKFWGWAWGCKKCRRAKHGVTVRFFSLRLCRQLGLLCCARCVTMFFFVATAVAFFRTFFLCVQVTVHAVCCCCSFVAAVSLF